MNKLIKKKSLGQHFLHAPAYLRTIADAGDLHPGESVVEVGPGDGALTEELLNRGVTVIAIEKDARLIPLLEEKFSLAIAAGKLILYEKDILEATDLILPKTYKVIANIPYYITGAVLKLFLTAPKQPSLMVVVIQKEVADRIARSKKESILSLSVKAYGLPSVVKKIPRGAFVPVPKVDSAILRIIEISRSSFKNKAHEERFFVLLHAGFGKKRKLLMSNLHEVMGKETAYVFQRTHIAEQARAEDVSLAQWLAISEVA